VSATQAADTDANGRGERQTILVNLALVEDAALGGVVGALGSLGARILALRKSEPSLEDVFVELVGRGFGDESTEGVPNSACTTDDAREHEPDHVG
jgi:hypothetical protein